MCNDVRLKVFIHNPKMKTYLNIFLFSFLFEAFMVKLFVYVVDFVLLRKNLLSLKLQESLSI